MHLLGRKLPQQEEEAQLASIEEQKDAADSEDDEKVVLQSHSVIVILRQLLALHLGLLQGQSYLGGSWLGSFAL